MLDGVCPGSQHNMSITLYSHNYIKDFVNGNHNTMSLSEFWHMKYVCGLHGFQNEAVLMLKCASAYKSKIRVI